MSSDIPESFIPELQSRKLISPPSQSWLQKSWSSPSKKSSKTIRDSIYSPSTSNYSNDFNSKNTKKEERKPGRKIPPKNLKIFSNSHLVSESTGRFWNQDVKTPQSESFEIGSGNEFESSSPLMDEEMIRDFPSPPAGFIGLQLDDRYGGRSGRSSNESDARIRDVIISPQLGSQIGSPNPSAPFEFDDAYLSNEESLSQPGSRASYSPISHGLSTPGTGNLDLSPFPGENSRHRFPTVSSQASFQTPNTDHFSFQRSRMDSSNLRRHKNALETSSCDGTEIGNDQMRAGFPLEEMDNSVPNTFSPSPGFYERRFQNSSYQQRVEGWVATRSSPTFVQGWDDGDVTQTFPHGDQQQRLRIVPIEQDSRDPQDQIVSPFRSNNLASTSTSFNKINLLSPINMDSEYITPDSLGRQSSRLLQVATSVLPEDLLPSTTIASLSSNAAPLSAPLDQTQTSFIVKEELINPGCKLSSDLTGSNASASLLPSPFDSESEQRMRKLFEELDSPLRDSFRKEPVSKESVSLENSRNSNEDANPQVGDGQDPDTSNSSLKIKFNPKRGGWIGSSQDFEEGEEGETTFFDEKEQDQSLEEANWQESKEIEKKSLADIESTLRERKTSDPIFHQSVSKILEKDAKNLASIQMLYSSPSKFTSTNSRPSTSSSLSSSTNQNLLHSNASPVIGRNRGLSDLNRYSKNRSLLPPSTLPPPLYPLPSTPTQSSDASYTSTFTSRIPYLSPTQNRNPSPYSSSSILNLRDQSRSRSASSPQAPKRQSLSLYLREIEEQEQDAFEFDKMETKKISLSPMIRRMEDEERFDFD